MKGDFSGLWGAAALAVVIALITAGRRLFPALSTILLWGGGLFLLLILAIFVLALVVSRDSGKKKQTAESAYDEILSSARSDLLLLHKAYLRVRNRSVTGAAAEIRALAEKILKFMKEKPRSVLQGRRFWNYYLPTTRKILEKYAYLEENGQISEETTENTLRCLEHIRLAMEQQREKLFAGDAADLTAEMEVLRTMCQRDGILTEADFSAGEESAAKSDAVPKSDAAPEAPTEGEEEFTDGCSDDLEDESGSARPG